MKKMIVIFLLLIPLVGFGQKHQPKPQKAEPNYFQRHEQRRDSILYHSHTPLSREDIKGWQEEDRKYYREYLRNPAKCRYEFVWQEVEDFMV